MTLDNIVEEIQNAKDIIVLTHDIPDGDAIGSSLALYIGLKQLGKKVDLIMPEYPETYNFLPCIDEVKKEGSRRSIWFSNSFRLCRHKEIKRF